MAADDLGRVEGELTAAVLRIHPGLRWEVGRRDGVHQLVVTAAGRAEPRSAAARWLLGAPAEQAGWAFHATRQADPAALSMNLTVGPGGAKLDLGELCVAVVEGDGRSAGCR
jgi:hypothetical protein